MKPHDKNKRCFLQNYKVVKEYIEKSEAAINKKWKNPDKIAVLKLTKHNK